MGSGLPGAATDVGDVHAMLSEENEPFVVACEDAALAGALRRLVMDTRLRARVGAANRARAERDYDQEQSFDAWATLLDSTRTMGMGAA